MRNKTTRPLLRTDNPRRTLEELLTERTPVYSLAPLKVRVEPGWTISQTAERVLRRLIEAGAVTEDAP